MTVTKVVDASALAAMLFGEPEAEAVAGRLFDVYLVAPTLIVFELANICVVKCRRHPDRREKMLQALASRTRIAVEELPVDPDDVAALSVETGLTAYDASYLWLSRRLGAELITLDKALARAAAAG